MIEMLVWVGLISWWWRYAARAIAAQARWDACRAAARRMTAEPDRAAGGPADWISGQALRDARVAILSDRMASMMTTAEMREMIKHRRVPADVIAAAAIVIRYDHRVRGVSVSIGDDDLLREVRSMLTEEL